MDLDQTFSYAIDQEIQAKEFYERSAAEVDNAEVKALFLSLARMEGAHRRALENEKLAMEKIGAFKEPSKKAKTPQAESDDSLMRIARVLKEANVELTSQHRRVEAELEAAGEIQEALLPRTVPQFQDLSISVSCSMAARVGGDYYDFLLTPGGNLALTIADVSGKGLPAALLMMAMRTLWRANVRQEEEPARALDNISTEATMELSQSDQFVTMISANYDQATHVLTFANAGHWPPLVLLPESNDFIPISSGFLPIGLGEERGYRNHSLDLTPGSLMVFFSDGIIDAAAPDNERFGESRLSDLVLDSRHLSADEVRDTVTTTLFEFSRGRQTDDQTLVVIKRK